MTAGDAALAAARAAFARRIAATAEIRTPGLADALAAVPRERFLRPGPWTLMSATNARQPPTRTPDADPAHVYDDASVAIDLDRQLVNGAPSFLARMIDLLELRPEGRVVHVGAGLGYYSALMAHVVGPGGHVTAIEADAQLAAEARENLADMPWVDLVHGDGAAPAGQFDAVLVNAGVSHLDASWLDGLAAGGRILVPLTVGLPGMGPTLGKGVMLLVERVGDVLKPEVISFVAIYSAVGRLRNTDAETQLGQAMRRTSFPNLTSIRRDPHDRSEDCWMHWGGACLTMGAGG